MAENNGLKAVVRRRLEFIEFNLLWERRIGRKQLEDEFGISLQQATVDLNTYLNNYPGSMAYDPRLKTYVPTKQFKPKLTAGTADEYLAQLEALTQGFKSEDELWIQNVPPCAGIRISSRPIDRKVLSVILEALRNSGLVSAKYVSMTSDREDARTLLPTGLASDGHRWHMRGYDVDKDRFSDFVISRFETVSLLDSVLEDTPEDDAWNTEVQIKFKVDPAVSQRQKQRLEYEYQMEDGQLIETVRQAMLFYCLRNYGFDPLPNEDGKMENKSSYRLKVKNMAEIEKSLNRR